MLCRVFGKVEMVEVFDEILLTRYGRGISIHRCAGCVGTRKLFLLREEVERRPFYSTMTCLVVSDARSLYMTLI